MINGNWNRMVAAIAMMAGSAAAQLFPPKPGDLAVSIPFEFAVAGKAMPAGDYIVRNDESAAELLVCLDGIDCARVSTHRIESLTPVARPQLGFAWSGSQIVLAEIWTPGASGRLVSGLGYNANGVKERRFADVTYVTARPLRIYVSRDLPVAWR